MDCVDDVDCVMFKIGVLRQTSHTALLSAIIWECVSYTLGILLEDITVICSGWCGVAQVRIM